MQAWDKTLVFVTLVGVKFLDCVCKGRLNLDLGSSETLGYNPLYVSYFLQPAQYSFM
jgi:hypothetical protein